MHMVQEQYGWSWHFKVTSGLPVFWHFKTSTTTIQKWQMFTLKEPTQKSKFPFQIQLVREHKHILYMTAKLSLPNLKQTHYQVFQIDTFASTLYSLSPNCTLFLYPSTLFFYSRIFYACDIFMYFTTVSNQNAGTSWLLIFKAPITRKKECAMY